MSFVLLDKVIVVKWFHPVVGGSKNFLEGAGTLKLPVEQHGYPVAGLFGAG